MIRKNTVILLLLSAILFNLTGCTSVPLTGRKRLAFIPSSQMVEMSQASYSKLISESRLSNDREKVQMIERCGRKITAAAEEFLKENGMNSQLKYYKWEFNLIENDDVINAFCMPGGKIAFYTGILKLATNEDYVAVVMGHEVAHAIARHGNERMSQMMLVQFGGVALNAALKEQPEKTRNIFMAAFGIGSQVGILLPYSRKHEFEADEIGLMLMAKAGYKPQAAADFWRKMNALGGSSVPEFLSTHPSSAARIQNMEKLIQSGNYK